MPCAARTAARAPAHAPSRRHCAQVFRTYNASITLDSLLAEAMAEDTVEGKKAAYDRANKEVGAGQWHLRGAAAALY